MRCRMMAAIPVTRLMEMLSARGTAEKYSDTKVKNVVFDSKSETLSDDDSLDFREKRYEKEHKSRFRMSKKMQNVLTLAWIEFDFILMTEDRVFLSRHLFPLYRTSPHM